MAYNNTVLLLLLFMILALNVGGLSIVFRIGHVYKREYTAMFILNILCNCINIGLCAVTGNIVVNILESLYYIAALLGLLMFYWLMTRYVNNGRFYQPLHTIVLILSGIDAILVASNPVTHLVFGAEHVDAPFRPLDIPVRVINYAGAYFHYFLCVGIALCYLIPLIRKSASSKGMYKWRYLGVLIVFFFFGTILSLNLWVNLTAPVSLLIQFCITALCFVLIDYFIPEEIRRKTLEESLKRQRSGLVAYDIEGDLAVVNDASFDYLGLPEGDVDALKARIKEILTARNGWDKEFDRWIEPIKSKENNVRYIQIEAGLLRDRHANKIGGFFSLTDHSREQMELQAEHYKATHDELTGLLNKEGFYEAVRNRMTAEPRRDYVIICTNVRDFKMINDLFGFDKGNEIIQKIGAMIDAGSYSKDSTARIVADQFAVLTTKDHVNPEVLKKQLDGISDIVTSSYYTMTIHCGIYEITNPDMDISLMCDRANMAISTIRDEAVNQVITYNDKMMTDILHDRQIANQVDQAVKNSEFLIYLQPQTDAQGHVLGAEALVRWNDPKRGILSPAAFIEILEKTSCLYRLDLHVWHLAAQQLAKWKGTPYENLKISVNISPKDFYYVDIYKEFTGLVTKYDIDPRKLNLEITETALMNEPRRQLTLIDRLHKFGFDFEIDDFGTGYSSLSMLKDMPADTLKIDMEFLHETENQQRSRMILESVISLARDLNMKVITEGVETESQLRYLSEMGCEIFQGYYFSPPIPVEEFEAKYPM